MFRNYLITALRNIVRHKLYSFINIAGLSVGLACATNSPTTGGFRSARISIVSN